MPFISPIPDGTLIVDAFGDLPTSGNEGQQAWVADDNELYGWDSIGGTWILIGGGGGGGGDMLVATYDPGGVAGDAFDADNHVYNNAASGLTATDVQAAIDEVEGRTDTLEGDSHTHANKAELDLVSDGDHDVRTDNPHSVTAVQAAYTATVDDDWPDPDPTEVQGALDDIAHRLHEAAHLGTAAFLARTIPNTDISPSEQRAVIGQREPRLVAAGVNGAPQDHDDANRGAIMVEITTLTVAGTLRCTGTSFDPDTGLTTPADTEDLVISATGWHTAGKLWEGTVVLSAIGGLDVVLDSYFWVDNLARSGLASITLIHGIAQWKAAAVGNSIRFVIEKFDPTARTMTTILDVTRAGITNGTSAQGIRTGLAISADVSAGEALHVFLEVLKVTNVSVLIGAESNI